MHTTVVDVGTLAAHVRDPAWLTVDCRFDLANPAAGERAFEQAHIPGAIYAHLDRDLAGPIGATTGRHPLPDPEVFARTLSDWGVGADTQVVAYDADTGLFAARLWWMVRWVGHSRVAVLDGGLRAWLAANRPTTNERALRTHARFVARPDRSMWVDAAFVDRVRNDPSYRILDARAPERFTGQVEPIDPIAGHVPGARNHPLANNVQDGRFASAEELRRRLTESQAGVADAQTIAMCGSGVTASHLLLAMEIAGKRGGKLYPGSWSEWIRDPAHAIAKNEG